MYFLFKIHQIILEIQYDVPIPILWSSWWKPDVLKNYYLWPILKSLLIIVNKAAHFSFLLEVAKVIIAQVHFFNGVWCSKNNFAIFWCVTLFVHPEKKKKKMNDECVPGQKRKKKYCWLAIERTVKSPQCRKKVINLHFRSRQTNF